MRRRDREVTDFGEIMDIVSRCEIVRLGLVDDGVPYIVPMSFGYAVEGEQVTFVFHSALVGRKIDIINKNPYACFELDCSFQITKNEAPCKWGAQHESVIGYGDITLISDHDEKKAAMDLIMKRYGFEGEPIYGPHMFSRTALYKLTVSEIAGKRNIPKAE